MKNKNSNTSIILTLSILILPSISYGNESDGFVEKTTPHCGLYCVYAAAKYLSVDVNFVDLVRPEYVGDAKGSSLNELKKCAEDIGMKAIAIQNIDTRFLKQISSTVILHVKNEYESKEYSHYILFIGTKNGKAIVFDSPEIKIISFGDLLPLMDGISLVLSNENISAGKLIWLTKGKMVLYTLIIFMLVNIFRFLFRKGRYRKMLAFLASPIGSYFSQAGIVIAFSFVTGFLFHFLGEGGYLYQNKYTEPIIYSYRSTFLPKIGKNEVKSLQRKGAIIIDARYAQDFEMGHLDGAINLPIDANDDLSNKILKNLNKESKIVVYCQSAGCEFANTISFFLKEHNFDDIVVYKGGWNDWIQ